jgi:hypothetical protein
MDVLKNQELADTDSQGHRSYKGRRRHEAATWDRGGGRSTRDMGENLQTRAGMCGFSHKLTSRPANCNIGGNVGATLVIRVATWGIHRDRTDLASRPINW